jgi:hypothetical protein
MQNTFNSDHLKNFTNIEQIFFYSFMNNYIEKIYKQIQTVILFMSNAGSGLIHEMCSNTDAS